MIKRYQKFYVILRHGKYDTVSIDRLKPAFIKNDETFNSDDRLLRVYVLLRVPVENLLNLKI